MEGLMSKLLLSTFAVEVVYDQKAPNASIETRHRYIDAFTERPLWLRSSCDLPGERKLYHANRELRRRSLEWRPNYP